MQNSCQFLSIILEGPILSHTYSATAVGHLLSSTAVTSRSRLTIPSTPIIQLPPEVKVIFSNMHQILPCYQVPLCHESQTMIWDLPPSSASSTALQTALISLSRTGPSSLSPPQSLQHAPGRTVTLNQSSTPFGWPVRARCRRPQDWSLFSELLCYNFGESEAHQNNNNIVRPRRRLSRSCRAASQDPTLANAR